MMNFIKSLKKEPPSVFLGKSFRNRQWKTAVYYGTISILFAILMSACRTPPPSNYNRPMPQSVLEQISEKMDQHEVKKVLGSPSIIDVFHPNLWVYLFITPDEKKIPWQLLITLDSNQQVEKIESRIANFTP